MALLLFFDNQSQHCWTCLDSKIKICYLYIGPLVHVYLILLACFGLWTRKMLYSLDKYMGNYRPSGITYFIEWMKIKGIVQGDVCQSYLKTFRMLRLFAGLCSLIMFDINNIYVIVDIWCIEVDCGAANWLYETLGWNYKYFLPK